VQFCCALARLSPNLIERFTTKRVCQLQAIDCGTDARRNQAQLATIYPALGTVDENVWRDEQQAWDSIPDTSKNKYLTREELHVVRSAIIDLQSDDALLDVFQQRLHSQAPKLGILPLQHIESGIAPQLMQNKS